MRPQPNHTIHIWWAMTPNAPITRPPHQHKAATTPPLRGPTLSSQPPQMAADAPRITMPMVNVQARSEIFQSQVVTVSCARKLRSFGQATEVVIPTAFESGSQKTDRP